MNLIEIIIGLHGLTSKERQEMLVDWGVESVLWPYIQVLYDQEGQFTEGIREIIISKLHELLS